MKKIDIVIPVYNALADVEQCILSVLANQDGFELRLILVNDASGVETTDFLHEMATKEPCIQLIESTINQGYSVSSNLGLEASTAPYVVLMNSDTIVSENWLNRLVHCAESSEDIGIVSPVTNAAIWQSVPYIPDKHTASTINFPSRKEIDDFAASVAKLSYAHYPELPYIHGYCQFIKREVLDAIGVVDAEHYPNGMGSELDFCFRAADAGFRSVVADDTFIYHGKAKSLDNETREESNWYSYLIETYGKERYDTAYTQIKSCGALNALREATSFHLFRKDLLSHSKRLNSNIAILVDAIQPNENIHSLLVACAVLWRKRDICVQLFIPEKRQEQVCRLYAEQVETHDLWLAYSESEQLLKHLCYFDVIVGTNPEVLSGAQSAYADTLTVLFANEEYACEAMSDTLILSDTIESAKALSSQTGRHVHLLEIAQIDCYTVSPLSKLLSFWYSERERLLHQKSEALLLLLKDALLYHRRDKLAATFSKGVPPQNDMIPYEKFMDASKKS